MVIIKMATKKPEQRELRKLFIQTLYDTLDGVVSPTPYLEIKDGDTIDVRFLDGKARLPMPNTTEVTVMDINVASLFFDDFTVLWEGVTGTGKSYVSDALGQTVCGLDGYLNLTLSSGILGTSAMEPFTKTVMDNGVPKTRIDKEKCEKYGIIFLDEINAGDFKDTSRVVEGVAQVNGDIDYLRLPIGNTGRHKKISVMAAMNPSDALHTHATELTIAGENRFLKFRFPNGVAEAGSSQLEKKVAGNLHDHFWAEFCQKTGMNGGWRELYPVVTDPEQFPSELDGETREFIDTALGYVGSDPKETFERNVELLQQGGVSPQFSIRDDNNYRKILELQGKLKHGFVRRDLRKIRDLSQLLGFIRGVKDGTYDASVRLNDVAAGFGVILEGKTITGTDYGSLMALVNDARSAYAALHQQMGIPESYGLRQAVWQAAIHAGQEQGFAAYMNTLRAGMAQLNTEAASAAQATLRSRILADLVVLEHFSKVHEVDVTAALKAKGSDTFKGFGELYQAKKGESSIYEHRLGSIMG